MDILIGNAFPLALVRRKVEIIPHSIGYLKKVLNKEDVRIYSFWGHDNTLNEASNILGVDLSPIFERPAVELNEFLYPKLLCKVFKECWILSPDFVPGLRPAIGEEVPNNKIIGWHALKIKWK